MRRLLLTAVLGVVALAAPARAEDDWWDDYQDYQEEQRDRYEDYLDHRRDEWRQARRAWRRARLAPRWGVYTAPELYPSNGGPVPGFRFNERYADPARGYYYSRYGRRVLPPAVVPAYPSYPPAVAWSYYPY